MSDSASASASGTESSGGNGTREDPWQLTTAPGTAAYQMWRDAEADPPALVCQVGSTTLKYHLRAIEDLADWLRAQGDWVDLGAADEQKPAKPGTVEAWGRDESNPVSGWYGLRKGYRGRFGMYLPACWSGWDWSSWNTTRATTASGPSDVSGSR